MKRALLVLLVWSATARAQVAADDVVEHVVAVVGEDAITNTELKIRSVASPQTALADLIDERLLLAEAERMRIAITREEIESALDAVAASNKVTRAELSRLVVEQMPEDLYRQFLRRQLVVLRALNTKASGLHLAKGASYEVEMAKMRKEWLASLHASTTVEIHDKLPTATTPSVACRTASVFKAPAQVDLQPVVRVEVRGQKRVDAAGICSQIRQQAGVLVDKGQAQRDLIELWKNGVFDDIAIVRSPGTSGVVLTYVVRERPSLSAITYSDNPALSQIEMQKVTGLSVGGVIDAHGLRRIAGRLQTELAAERGYGNAKVTFETKPDGDGFMRVRFIVIPGPKTLIASVRFAGNSRATDDDLRKAIAVAPHPIRAGALYHQTEVYDVASYITSYYYDHGMVNADVKVETPSDDKTGAVAVVYQIREGDVFTLGQITYAGTLGDKARYEAAFGIKSGVIFSRTDLANARKRLVDVHKQFGGSDDVTPETTIHEHVVDIVWRCGR